MLSLEDHENRIQELELHKKLCDEMHDASKEHRKRSDDAMNNLTKSNVILAESIDSMNRTILDIIHHDRPIVERSRNFWSLFDNFSAWMRINKNIGKYTVAAILLIASIAAAFKTLGIF